MSKLLKKILEKFKNVFAIKSIELDLNSYERLESKRSRHYPGDYYVQKYF